jgi:transcriptional antiterminator
LVNENERLSASQVEVYFNYRIFDIVSNVVSLESIYDLEQPDLPEDLEKIMSVMLNNLYDAYFANAYLNLGMVEIVENGSLMDQSQYSYFTETEIQDMFNQLKDVYNYQVTSQYE